jgi:hypothetical protein
MLFLFLYTRDTRRLIPQSKRAQTRSTFPF